jgi:hypothetical protein
MNEHEQKKYIVVKKFFKKGPTKWFGHFLFFNHSLRWFLMVSPKDGFAYITNLAYHELIMKIL